ncbi:hypothetical protein RHECNPAF_25300115 [Rhizobium etli CNPAF512]|nr:hypothetical protein RHECNPAF_25300115 [Rhizobium etli CNPAF512]
MCGGGRPPRRDFRPYYESCGIAAYLTIKARLCN